MTRVTPFAGVWIEIHPSISKSYISLVTPFAGVWIEIAFLLARLTRDRVTPFAGVWIEIFMTRDCRRRRTCH